MIISFIGVWFLDRICIVREGSLTENTGRTETCIFTLNNSDIRLISL